MKGITVDLLVSLGAAVKDARLDPEKLTVALPSGRPGQVEVGDRHSILVYDGTNFATWLVPSLRDLLRGDRQQPADMDHYPKDVLTFIFLRSTS